MGDAARAQLWSPGGRRGSLGTQNATVERNVRAPADVEECAGDLMGVDINIAALAGRDR